MSSSAWDLGTSGSLKHWEGLCDTSVGWFQSADGSVLRSPNLQSRVGFSIFHHYSFFEQETNYWVCLKVNPFLVNCALKTICNSFPDYLTSQPWLPCPCPQDSSGRALGVPGLSSRPSEGSLWRLPCGRQRRRQCQRAVNISQGRASSSRCGCCHTFSVSSGTALLGGHEHLMS